MAQYWVVGGEYTDTHFHEALDGNEEWIGPFGDYQTAKQEWAKRAWRTVDDCHARYRIERIDPDSPPACTD
ncbi:MAG: DUF4170 domain-containing protein [Kiloniellales bacterium]